MLSRPEIDAKCTKPCNGVCDMLKGHAGPCRSSNGYVLTPVK